MVRPNSREDRNIEKEKKLENLGPRTGIQKSSSIPGTDHQKSRPGIQKLCQLRPQDRNSEIFLNSWQWPPEIKARISKIVPIEAQGQEFRNLPQFLAVTTKNQGQEFRIHANHTDNACIITGLEMVVSARNCGRTLNWANLGIPGLEIWWSEPGIEEKSIFGIPGLDFGWSVPGFEESFLYSCLL